MYGGSANPTVLTGLLNSLLETRSGGISLPQLLIPTTNLQPYLRAFDDGGLAPAQVIADPSGHRYAVDIGDTRYPVETIIKGDLFTGCERDKVWFVACSRVPLFDLLVDCTYLCDHGLQVPVLSAACSRAIGIDVREIDVD